MKTRIVLSFLTSVLAFSGMASAQDKVPKVAILNIQAAIAQSNDGQKAAKELSDRFASKREELVKAQQEINDLQNQLRDQARTLSEEARVRLQRSLDDKTRAFTRANEDATAEWQDAEQDAINDIGRKMMGVVTDYSTKNGYALVLDVSSPQTPVLYADTAIDITEKIIELYNQAMAAGKPASPAAPPTGTAPQAPAPAAPAPAPQSEAPAPPSTPPAR